jgi:hypothetical protein
MGSVRSWAAGSVVAALILLSPIIAFLMLIVAEMQIDLLMEAGTAADCTIAVGAIGWALFHGRSLHSEIPAQSEPEGEPDEAAIAAPPM